MCRSTMRRSPLENPRTSAHAWARYRRMMKGMGLFALVTIGAVLGTIYWQSGPVSAHLFIASALGIGCTIMLAAALMGLMFLSSGTGHDESVADFADEDQSGLGSGRGRKR